MINEQINFTVSHYCNLIESHSSVIKGEGQLVDSWGRSNIFYSCLVNTAI